MFFRANRGAEIILRRQEPRATSRPWIREHGGVPSLWKTGHSLIKARMRERGAALAGEMSGHTFFVRTLVWVRRRAIRQRARLLEILSKTPDAHGHLERGAGFRQHTGAALSP